MCSNINDCGRLRTGSDWCRLNQDCAGWGCRLLTILPAEMPVTEHDRAKLFSRVYRAAERIGVLACPFFDENKLDSMVEDDALLLSIRNCAKDLQI